MAFEFTFPDVGQGITEGQVVKWLVKEGDSVTEDQDIVKVETDKAIVDIPSPRTGTILAIKVKEGNTVKVRGALVIIGESGESPTNITESPKKSGSVAVVGELEEAPDKPLNIPKQSILTKSVGPKVLATPLVRKKAAELKVDLATIQGSGPNNRILERDLTTTKKEPTTESSGVSIKRKYDSYGYLERIPLKGIRKKISESMMTSLSSTAQLTTMDDIDCTKLWKLRLREKKRLASKKIKLTFMPFIIKAVIMTLKEYPWLNASVEGEEIIVKKYYNIGIAVDTDDGLIVPVIKIAENKSIETLAKEIITLATKSKERTIDLMDMQGSTFTITNYGSIGGKYGTPILNLNESAILGLGRIFDDVVIEKGRVKQKKMLPISLSYDHRVIDGAMASRFIEKLRLVLAEPNKIK
ncbi:branched-chain alpha-keto acid dehydrogenase subunit E2 [archaeon]|nr:branched-chain alpha-keto acid dehydrogenase subunit E2 [archaeon]